MKTVSGNIVSTKPVSLSKAANILSNFVTSDNGASQPVTAYLRRASTAFNEHVYFKKHQLKKHRAKEDTSSKSDINPRSSEVEARDVENGDQVMEERENGKVEGNLRKKEKRKKKDKGSLGNGKVEEDNEKKKKKKGKGSLGNGNIQVEVEEDNEKKKKKRKKTEVDGEEIGTPKRKKRRRCGSEE